MEIVSRSGQPELIRHLEEVLDLLAENSEHMSNESKPKSEVYMKHNLVACLALASCSLVANTCFGQGFLVPTPDPSDLERLAKLDSIIGKPLFACSNAVLNNFELPHATTTDPDVPRIIWKDKFLGVPLLTPLVIHKAVILGKVDQVYTIGLILAFSDKSAAATVHLSATGPLLAENDLLKALVHNSSTNLLAQPPADFSKDEIEAIQFHIVEKGMLSSEVRCARGSPEKINDYGSGGEQWIYYGGKFVVYIDSKEGRVTEIQQFDD